MPEDEAVSRREHEEFTKRVDEHFDRVDGRLKCVEASAAAIDRLATNMEHMVTEQRRQGDRLEKLEAQDGQKYRQLIGYACTAIVSVLAGVIVAVLTMGL